MYCWYDDTGSTFQELLQHIKSASLHHKNIQTLTTEKHKIVDEFILQFWEYFLVLEKNKYNFRNFKEMKQQKIKLFNLVSKQLSTTLLN